MRIDRNESESVRQLRARLEALAARDRHVERMAAKAVLNHFPHHYQRVILGLERAGLLLTTEIDYVDCERRRVEFAWPEKMVGLRVAPWPLGAGCGRTIPDFVYSDAALRDLGWLILSIDPSSSNFEEQLDRVVSVVKRVGAYRGPRR